MSNRAPVRRLPMVFSLDEKRPGLEANQSLPSGVTLEMNGSTSLLTKCRTKIKYNDERTDSCQRMYKE